MTTWSEELTRSVGPYDRVSAISGGDINDAFRVTLRDGTTIFVKTHASPPAGMFVAEADGLAWIAEGPLRTPRVIAAGETFLALEWLDLGARTEPSEAALGRGLAALHELGAPSFGYARPNYLATLPQDNTPAPDIATFYLERRLRPLLTRLGDATLVRALDAIAPDRFGPPEPPARLHGDLWWGNVVFVDGAPVLIDPAVYGGHREIDLAMLRLFGGLSDTLAGAYHEVYPLEAGWRARVPLWQLYPLAAHAVLFGGGYARQVATILDDLT